MRVEERIRALEARFISDPVILYFADGSTREFAAQRLPTAPILCHNRRRRSQSRQAAELDLILDSVFAGGAELRPHCPGHDVGLHFNGPGPDPQTPCRHDQSSLRRATGLPKAIVPSLERGLKDRVGWE